MTFPVLSASNPSGYQISRSLRLRCYPSLTGGWLSKTYDPGGQPDSNNKIKTFSVWLKRGRLATPSVVISNQYDSNNYWSVFFDSNDALNIVNYAAGVATCNVVTTQVFRDVSSWYHFLIAVDTTQATAANRVKPYVNGNQITSFSTATYMNQNDVSASFLTPSSNIWFAGIGAYNLLTSFYDGMLAEFNVIDGQALTPSSFGYFDPITGVWTPKKYAGTYGNQGLYLKFIDNSSVANLGIDYSGNGRNWTPNNVSLAAGPGYDSFIDTPTPYADGGNGRGNYCILDQSDRTTQSGTNIYGNLLYSANGANANQCNGSLALFGGKWYWEMGYNTIASGYPICGIQAVNTMGTTFSYPGIDSYGWGIDPSGRLYTSNAVQATYSAITTSDIVMFAYDASNGKFWIGKNGTWFGSGDPASGTLPVATTFFYASGTLPAVSGYQGSEVSANFGQRPFFYTPPAGFKAINTQNLSAVTINNGSNYMAATLYAGTGASQNIVNSGAFQPDLVWAKSRNVNQSHYLANSISGVNKYLQSDTTGAEQSVANSFTSFNSNGFTIGSSGAANTSPYNYVGWQWKAGSGTTSSNTSGTITSTVSVNQSVGFSVVSYVGNGSISTVGHGLSATPSLIIVKNRNQVTDWPTFHVYSSPALVFFLNRVASVLGSTYWNSTSPTSQVFTVGTNSATNQNAQNFIAYCWAPVRGYSSFGSYAGNGLSTGPFVYCGFRPRWVMIKRYDTNGNWQIVDSSRGPGNVNSADLYANLSGAEDSAGPIDFLANGFKLRSTGSDTNASGGVYMYMAFAENPINNALAR